MTPDYPAPRPLLTQGQAYSDSPDAFSNPEDTFSRGQHFFQEAEKLWTAQRGRQTLSNIQALLMMCSVYVIRCNVLIVFSGYGTESFSQAIIARKGSPGLVSAPTGRPNGTGHGVTYAAEGHSAIQEGYGAVCTARSGRAIRRRRDQERR